jgi:hypothetical protein
MLKVETTHSNFPRPKMSRSSSALRKRYLLRFFIASTIRCARSAPDSFTAGRPMSFARNFCDGIARFYLIYFRDYLANLWRLRDHNAAYRNIPFEKEAYERERDCDRGRV